jgi:REP element-mobilizing transposase RayT
LVSNEIARRCGLSWRNAVAAMQSGCGDQDTHNSASSYTGFRFFLHLSATHDATLAACAPRSQLIDSTEPGYFHCVSRCVRRAFLCGVDSLSGSNFEHRKAWVEDRLMELAECFAVGIYAYAVMSNHLHVVVLVDPDVAGSWSAEEVARRWVRLFPVREQGGVDKEACCLRAQVLAGDATRIAELRARLASISWFMRCLSEPIARRANREDNCTGRFWEG